MPRLMHIGQLIAQEMHRQERSPSWLARHICCDRTNVYKIFQRESIDTSLLMRISKALNRNFFEELAEFYEQSGNEII